MVIEIKNPYTQIPEAEIHEKPEKNRAGKTTITSVSLSDEFREIVDKHNLSPTDVFRRGVGVTLADMGVFPYNTSMNNKRLDAVRSKLELEKMEDLADKLQEVSITLKKILDTTK